MAVNPRTKVRHRGARIPLLNRVSVKVGEYIKSVFLD